MLRLTFYSSLCIISVLSLVFFLGRSFWYPSYSEITGARTVSDVLKLYESSARSRLEPFFETAGVPYLASQYWLVAYKDQRRLELRARDDGETASFIKSYPVKAASGVLGPKLREGDRQVPEGIYQIQWLHPNSSYHLSMKLNYPNAFDLTHANLEGRDKPGSNIFIHGKAVSIGCLALGDEAIEELFVLAALAGHDKFTVIISPHDPKQQQLRPPAGSPAWVSKLYKDIEKALAVVNP